MYAVYVSKVRLPIAPPKLTMTINGQNETLNLIDGTEINILKRAGLTEITFDARFPAYRYSFSHSNFRPISYYLEKLEKLKQNRKGFQFIVTRNIDRRLVISDDENFATNLTVSLEDYKIVEDAEDGLDCVVSITLKQYIPYGTKTVVLKETKKTQTTSKKKVTVKKQRTAKEKRETKYTIQSGDNLWNIARKFYGDSTKWQKIYNANKTVIEDTAKKYGRASSSNGWWIYPGTVLTIPAD